MTNEASFEITYNGPALDGGRMDVRELAPALLAVSGMLREANRVSGTFESSPTVHIQGTREGSFVLELVAESSSIIEQAMDLFTGKPAQASTSLITLVGATYGAIRFVKKVNGRKVSRIDSIEDGHASVTMSDGETFVVPESSITISSDSEFRRAAREVIEPVEKSGIDSVTFDASGTSQEVEAVTVTSGDFPAFEVPELEGDEDLNVIEYDSLIFPLTINFDLGKWKVSDGEASFFVSIEDPVFRSRVENGESFGKGDILKVRMRHRSYRTKTGDLKSERIVLEVTDHVQRARQIAIPFESDDA